MSDQEVAATQHAVMKTILNIHGMQGNLEQITWRQRTLGEKLKGVAFEIWAVVQQMVKEGLVSNTSQVGKLSFIPILIYHAHILTHHKA